MSSIDSDTRTHDQELAGLDLLELAGADTESRGRRVWRAAWPKVAALVLGIGVWQVVVWSGWRPEYVLAPPRDAWDDLWAYAADGTLTTALGITMRRAAIGPMPGTRTSSSYDALVISTGNRSGWLIAQAVLGSCPKGRLPAGPKTTSSGEKP